MWTLIVLSWFTGYVGGYQVVMSDFTSQDSCQAAVQLIEKTNDGNTIRAVCTPK